MPVYEYLCRDCGNDFEVKQSFKDASLTICPKCGGHIYRKIQAAGVVFKGSGWYVNDSKSKNAAAPSAASSSEEKKHGDAASTTESGEKKASESTTNSPAAEPTKTKESPPAASSSPAA